MNVITVSAKYFKPFFFGSKSGSEKYFLTLEIVHGIVAKSVSDWEQRMLHLPEFFQKMVCFGVAVCEILRVEIKKTAFSRVDVLLITIRGSTSC